jgi:hypothetical protein
MAASSRQATRRQSLGRVRRGDTNTSRPILNFVTTPRPQPLAGPLSEIERARVRAGIEASERDDAIELTAEEADHYYASGVLPERVTKWAASRG